MKDFQLRNDTRLLFKNDPSGDLENLTKGKKVLFVYGGGSVHKNGCYKDVKKAVLSGGGGFYEFGNSSREFADIEKGIRLVKENGIELIIGAGGASIMDSAFMELPYRHQAGWGLEKLRITPMIYMNWNLYRKCCLAHLTAKA